MGRLLQKLNHWLSKNLKPNSTQLAIALVSLFLQLVGIVSFLTIVQDDLPATFEVLIGLAIIVGLGQYRRSHPRSASFDGGVAFVLFLLADALGLGTFIATGRSDFATIVLALMAFLALGEVVLELRKSRVVWKFGWAAAIAGALLGLFGILFWKPTLILLSFAIAPVAIALATPTVKDGPRLPAEALVSYVHLRLLQRIPEAIRSNSGGAFRKIPIIGNLSSKACVHLIVTVAAGTIGASCLSWAFGWAHGYAAFVGVLVFVTIHVIIANNNADAALVVVVVAFSWALQPRSAPDPATHLPPSGPTILAIGDSYQSGEGAPVYIDGTNQSDLANALDNKCRRAPTAYPVLLATGMSGRQPQRLVFLACSGAKAIHVMSHNQYEGEGDPTVVVKVPKQGSVELQRRGASQLTLARRVSGVSTVFVSIGGNDIGFGDLVRYCLGPTNCASKQAQAAIDHSLGTYREALVNENVFQHISDAFNGAQRVLVPYPIPVAEQRCMWSPMSTAEHQQVISIVKRLNGINRVAAVQAGFAVAPTESAFLPPLDSEQNRLPEGDRRICGNGNLGSAVNLFALNPESNPLAQVAFPKNWFHNSVHPTPLGHRLMAGLLAERQRPCVRNEPPCANSQPPKEPSADLTVSHSPIPMRGGSGSQVTYRITVGNDGPDDVRAAAITQTLPEDFTDVSWTCTASAGTCDTPKGSGAIRTTEKIPWGATRTYSVSATIRSKDRNGGPPDSVKVASLNGVEDLRPDNNECVGPCSGGPQPVGMLGEDELQLFFLRLFAGLFMVTATALLTHDALAKVVDKGTSSVTNAGALTLRAPTTFESLPHTKEPHEPL